MKSGRADALFWLVGMFSLLLDQLTKFFAFRALPAPGATIPVIPGVFQLRRVENAGALFGMCQGHGWLFLAGAVPGMLFVTYLYFSSRARTRLAAIGFGLILGGILGNTVDRGLPYLRASTSWLPAGAGGARPTRADYDAVIPGASRASDVLRLFGPPGRRDLHRWLYRFPDKAVEVEILFDEAYIVRRKGWSVDSFVKDFLDFVLIRWPTFNVADALLCIGVAIVGLQLFRRRGDDTPVSEASPTGRNGPVARRKPMAPA